MRTGVKIMNNEYKKSNETIYINDDNGPRKVPSTKYAVEIIKIENELECLKTKIDSLQKELEGSKSSTSKGKLAVLVLEILAFWLITGKIGLDIADFAKEMQMTLTELIFTSAPLLATIVIVSVGTPILVIKRFFNNKNRIPVLEAQILELNQAVCQLEAEKDRLTSEDAPLSYTTEEPWQSLEDYNKTIRNNMIKRLRMISKLYKDRMYLQQLYETGNLPSYFVEKGFSLEESERLSENFGKIFALQQKNPNE